MSEWSSVISNSSTGRVLETILVMRSELVSQSNKDCC